MLNDTASYDYGSPELDPEYHSILIACSLVICIANIPVITLFLTQTFLRSSGNYLLFSLALADLAVGLIGIPLNITCEMVLDMKSCIASYSVNRVIAVTIVYHILWITLEKYTAIVHPFFHKLKFDHKKVKIICLCTWLCSLIVGLIEISWLYEHEDPYMNYPEDIRRKERIYNIFIFSAVFIFPITVMFFAYTSIFLQILRQHSNEILRKHMRGNGKSLRPRASRNAKTALLFFVIHFVFILAWFWWFFVVLYYNILHKQRDLMNINVVKFLVLFRYSTSFINPLLYTFFKRDFYKALRKFLNRSRLTPAKQQRSISRPAVGHFVSQGTTLSSIQTSFVRSVPAETSPERDLDTSCDHF